MVVETGFDSSPATKGVLLRASKPDASDMQSEKRTSKSTSIKYQDFFDEACTGGFLDQKTKYLIALGASLSLGSEPLTQHFLEIAKRTGATVEELEGTATIAMTIGAMRIKILHENASGWISQVEQSGCHMHHEGSVKTEGETCST